MLSVGAAEALGPVCASRGWVVFMPYRRGQGLSASAGAYIMDEVDAAEKKGGIRAAAATVVRLLENDHLDDQLAAAKEGHTLGYFGSSIWVDDVFRFRERHCVGHPSPG
jgi:hypothetical protein